jgi:hypothetical protein
MLSSPLVVTLCIFLVFSCAIEVTHLKRYGYLDKTWDKSIASRAVLIPNTIHHNGSTSASRFPAGSYSFWLEDLKHQGIASFNNNKSYQVFRNVKDFGAKGAYNDID